MQNKNKMRSVIDRMFELHPNFDDPHEVRVNLCEEFLKTTRDMQGTDLEPYLASIKYVQREGTFSLEFKIPIIPYSELLDC